MHFKHCVLLIQSNGCEAELPKINNCISENKWLTVAGTRWETILSHVKIRSVIQELAVNN